jgi:class 3 adenylate cyclase
MKDEMLNTLERLRWEAELTKKNLKKKTFDLQTIYDLSEELGYLGDIQVILENLLMMVMGNLGAMHAVILLVDNNKNKIERIIQRGMENTTMDVLSAVVESGNFRELQKATDVQILDEKNDGHHKNLSKIFDLLSYFKIKKWVSFKINENLSCSIGLGVKLSSAPYTEDDCDLLRALANYGVLAIKNAKFIEQIKKDQTVRINLERYLSPHVVEQVIKKDVQVNLGGDRKIVTVLYSDIRDFTRITEDRPPDQLILILNEYFTEMARIIFENKGSLDKYIGDAIVAVFGSLIPLKNHPHNAVHTAIKMMKSLQILNEKWKNEYNFTMEIGIGISSGEVFLGNIGSPERMEFTVIGDTVNVAARFSGLAREGQILITKDILSSLDPNIKYVELPPRDIKGKREKLDIFEIVYT